MLGAEDVAGVTEVGVERTEVLELLEAFLVEEINLIEDEYRGHVVGLTGSQETVDKGGAGTRMIDGHDERYLVDISGQDMRLFRQVSGPTHDIVAPVRYGGNPRGAIW